MRCAQWPCSGMASAASRGAHTHTFSCLPKHTRFSHTAMSWWPAQGGVRSFAATHTCTHQAPRASARRSSRKRVHTNSLTHTHTDAPTARLEKAGLATTRGGGARLRRGVLDGRRHRPLLLSPGTSPPSPSRWANVIGHLAATERGGGGGVMPQAGRPASDRPWGSGARSIPLHDPRFRDKMCGWRGAAMLRHPLRGARR